MLLSGGIDSATCLFLAGKKKGYSCRALTIKIHGMARGEIAAARGVAREGGAVEHRFVSIPQLRELGDMRDARALGGRLPPTFIPMKNAIYYSIAAAYAEETGASYILGGHNRDDTKLFEDTSREFFLNLQRTLWSASERLRTRRTTLLRPLQHMTKAEVIVRAGELGVPFALTWSCHRQGVRHCWECEGCRQRVRAFRSAGVKDPLSAEKV